MDTKIMIETLKTHVGYNLPATLAQIKMCNMKLKQNNLPEIPIDFANLLMQCNGFSNDDAEVFGAESKGHNVYRDLVEYNLSFFRHQAASWLVLGKDDMYFLGYDQKKGMYAIIDQDTLEAEFSTESLPEALGYILRVDLND
ncbi:MAG: hypothetical protein IJ852_04990 [Alphaproteobacteria bacterium]|nr:hypothetical protein [Alphaproteobacteria bacterium]